MSALDDAAYESLNERQQAFIDAIALLELERGESVPEGKTYSAVSYTITDIGKKMREEFDADPYEEGKITQTLKKRRGLIDERKQMLANERNGFEGRVKTETGNASYEGPAEGIDATMQWITERPVQGVEQKDDEILVTLSFTEEDLFRFIREYPDERMAREIFEEMVLDG